MNSNWFQRSANGKVKYPDTSDSDGNIDPRLIQTVEGSYDSPYSPSANLFGDSMNFGGLLDNLHHHPHAPTPQLLADQSTAQAPASDNPPDGSNLWHNFHAHQTPYFVDNQNWSNFDPRVDGINPQLLSNDDMLDQRAGPTEMGGNIVNNNNESLFAQDLQFSHGLGQPQALHAHGQQMMQAQTGGYYGQIQYLDDAQFFPQTSINNDDDEVQSPPSTKKGKQNKEGKKMYKLQGKPRQSKGQATTNITKNGIKVYPHLPREAYLLRPSKVMVNAKTEKVTDDIGNDVISEITGKPYRKLHFLPDTLTYGQCTGEFLLRAELNGASLTGDIIPRIDASTITGVRGPAPHRSTDASSSSGQQAQGDVQTQNDFLPTVGTPDFLDSFFDGVETPYHPIDFGVPPFLPDFGNPAPAVDFEAPASTVNETPGLATGFNTLSRSADAGSPNLVAGDAEDDEHQDEDVKGGIDDEFISEESTSKKHRTSGDAQIKKRSQPERLNRCLSNKRQKYRWENSLGFSPAANLVKKKKGKDEVTTEAERILGPLGGGRHKNGLGLTVDQLILNTIGEVNHKTKTFRISYGDGTFQDFPVDTPRDVPEDERHVLKETNPALYAALVSKEEFLLQHPEYVDYKPALSSQSMLASAVSSSTHHVPAQSSAAQKRKRSAIEKEDFDTQARLAPHDRSRKKARGLQTAPAKLQIERPVAPVQQQLELPGLSALSGFPITPAETYREYANAGQFFEMENETSRVIELGHGRLVAVQGWLLEYFPNQPTSAVNQSFGMSEKGFDVESGKFGCGAAER